MNRELIALRRQVQKLERRVAALKKDKNRMNWIIKNANFIEVEVRPEYGNSFQVKISPDRRSIDYALKEAKP